MDSSQSFLTKLGQAAVYVSYHLRDPWPQPVSPWTTCSSAITIVLFEVPGKKRPISFKLLRALSCLNPCLMVSNPASCRSNFKVVDSLLQSNRLTELNSEAIIRDYEAFLDNIPQAGSDDFSSFSWRMDRLDDFLLPLVKGQFDKLVPVLRILLILSHGQAAVERGFSVNNELEVENLQERSLVAQRLVCEYVKLHGGASQVPLTNTWTNRGNLGRHRRRQERGRLPSTCWRSED